MRSGAMGYVSKYAPREELIKAILEVNKGNKYICDSIKNELAEQMIKGDENKNALNSLTRRELEIIRFIKEGSSSKKKWLPLYFYR